MFSLRTSGKTSAWEVICSMWPWLPPISIPVGSWQTESTKLLLHTQWITSATRHRSSNQGQCWTKSSNRLDRNVTMWSDVRSVRPSGRNNYTQLLWASRHIRFKCGRSWCDRGWYGWLGHWWSQTWRFPSFHGRRLTLPSYVLPSHGMEQPMSIVWVSRNTYSIIVDGTDMAEHLHVHCTCVINK